MQPWVYMYILHVGSDSTLSVSKMFPAFGFRRKISDIIRGKHSFIQDTISEKNFEYHHVHSLRVEFLAFLIGVAVFLILK